MKKRLLIFFSFIISLTSCDVANQMMGAYNMVNCEYDYKSISGLSISGMNLSKGLSIMDMPKITSLLSGNAKSIPLNFTLNLDVKNPNQSAALLSGLQYIISVDGIQFTTGSMNRQLNIASGQSQTLPLTIGVDLAELMKNNSKNAVTDIAKNFIGMGTKKSQVSLQIKPTFMVGSIPITSPTYIPISFSFGG